jgi:hypothetical protein
MFMIQHFNPDTQPLLDFTRLPRRQASSLPSRHISFIRLAFPSSASSSGLHILRLSHHDTFSPYLALGSFKHSPGLLVPQVCKDEEYTMNCSLA